MENRKQEILEAAKNKTLYGYIRNNSWRMDKSELENIIAELLWIFSIDTSDSDFIDSLEENL
jgi:hypothetical protein